ncbi:hypothetical protein ACROYT_G030396 [Oculina patagonica]
MKHTANATPNFSAGVSTEAGHLGEKDFAVISAYIFIVGVLGFIGNLWVIVAFCRYKNLRTSTNIFIVHLAGCDLFLAFMDLAFSFPSSVEHRWLFGTVACEIFGFAYHFLNAMSLNTLAVISLDRFWVITKPSFGAKITVKRAVFCVVLTYFYTLLFTLPIMLGWIGFHEEIYFTGCYLNFEKNDTRTLTYSIAMAVFLFLVPFVIMVYCYCSIFASVRKRGKRNTRLKRSRKGNCKFTLPHWRTARMIVVVIFVFLLCWSPHVIVSLCVSFGLKISILIQEVTLLFAKSGIIYNPFIYAVLNHRFRSAFIGMVCQKKRENGADCSRTPVASGGLGSSFRISRASTSAKTLSERLSEKEIDLASASADHCRLKRICYYKARLNLSNLGELNCAQNETLNPNGLNVTTRHVKILQLEQLDIENDEKEHKAQRLAQSIH